MAEIEKSLRKALEEKVANLEQGTSSTALKDSASEASEKNDKVTVSMDKLTHDKQGAAESQKGGISDQTKSNSDQNGQGAKSEKEHKISNSLLVKLSSCNSSSRIALGTVVLSMDCQKSR